MSGLHPRLEPIADLLAAGQPLDPYIVWGLLTQFRYYRAGEEPLCLSIAAELSSPAAAAKDDHTGWVGAWNLPDVRYVTGCVPLDQLPTLLRHPGIKRVELGAAVVPAQGTVEVVAQSIDEGVAVAVIDDFIAFQHDCFHDANGTRFESIWSQDRQRPDSLDPDAWKAKVGLRYGFEWTRSASTMSTKLPPDLPDPAYPKLLPRRSHGTGVAYLACGNGPEMTNVSTARLLGVHLPQRTLRDTSGGSLNVQALDALFYILAKCGPQVRVVVNMSYATMAGAHDGTSILEAAIDELIELRKGKLAVVLPSGNAYEQRAHASFTLTAAEPERTLSWFVPPALQRPSFLEIWLPAAGLGLDIELRSPDGGISIRTTGDPQIDWRPGDGGEPVCAVIRLAHVANGTNGTMVLLALAATAAPDGLGALSPAGVWSVKCTLTRLTDVVPVRAWIERGDSLPEFPDLGVQSYFADPCYEEEGQTPMAAQDGASVVQRRGAFNPIACGSHTLVAGGYRGLYTPQVRAYADGTGSGPLRTHVREGPDFNACTETSAEIRNLLVAANRPAEFVPANGTSLAAPQLARRAAALLAGSCMEPAALRDAIALSVIDNDPPAGPDYEREGRGRLPCVLDAGPATFGRPAR